jgi:Protein kinase domain
VNIISHDIAFSFEQSERSYNSIAVLLRQKLGQPVKKASLEMTVRKSLTVLIIDALNDNGRYLANVLTSMGYHPIVVADALSAHKLFIRGEFSPFAIIQIQYPKNSFEKRDTLQRKPYEANPTKLVTSSLGDSNDNSDNIPFFLERLAQQMQQKYAWDVLFVRLHFEEGNSSKIPSPSPQTTRLGPRRTVPLDSKVHQNIPDITYSRKLENSPFLTKATSTPQHLVTLMTEQRNIQSASHLPVQATLERIALEGHSLGRYKIVEMLGNSLHSGVYKTYDRLREQEGALKAIPTNIIPSSPVEGTEHINFFQQEAELLNKLKHSHILPVLNCGETYVIGSSFIYKTMQYCPERSLAYWLYKRGNAGTFDVRDAIALIMQLADALQFVHDNNAVYQNFKMSNILILKAGRRLSDMQFALADFASTQSKVLFASTPDAGLYMAPEHWEGFAFPASDQYGLAAIAYELLTGRPPFQGSSERTLMALHKMRQPKPPTELNSALPMKVNGILLRALAKQPEARFASILSFATALSQCWR